ncbi:MAG TPA: transglutaminase-like domain-containing protein [Desulfatiglandales bacterium]|nr:transglutaminase-like domain-containing protein [Desulfatiglandales bacterium]
MIKGAVMEDFPLYLKPTYYIDFDSPRISLVCKDLAIPDPREQARAIFYFVRDRITYNPYSPFCLPEHYPASRTLERGEGFCVQKAVLLTALARAFNIPARLVFANIRNHLMPPKLWGMMQTNIFVFHGYNELYIDGRWVKITPTFDAGMCNRLNIRPVEFDGFNPAVFHSHDLNGQLHIEYIAEHGHFADLPFKSMLDGFSSAYTEDMIRRWKDSSLQTEKGG